MEIILGKLFNWYNCYFELMPLSKSKFLLRTNTILSKVLVRLVAVHGCETWTIMKLKE